MDKYFLYETHLHTKSGSACANLSGAELVDCFKEKGYSGFVVTDHFMNGNTAVSRELPWERQIDQFTKGYLEAKARGDEIDFDVFFALEFNFRGTEFLIYGVDSEWLKAHPQIMELNLPKALKLFREAGAFIIHAHPYREDSYIEMIRLLPSLTDAVEIYNEGNMFRNPSANSRALFYAGQYKLPITTGSDMHGIGFPITAGIAVKNRLSSINDFIDVIKNRQSNVIINGLIFSQFDTNNILAQL